MLQVVRRGRPLPAKQVPGRAGGRREETDARTGAATPDRLRAPPHRLRSRPQRRFALSRERVLGAPRSDPAPPFPCGGRAQARPPFPRPPPPCPPAPTDP